MKDYQGNEDVFRSDISKACHHGSDDVSYSFLETIEPACSIISSGDSEGHDHPRPEIIAACGSTGRKTIKDDQLVTPLVYSTELARSVSLGEITKVLEMSNATGGSQVREYDTDDLGKLKAKFKVTDAGARNPKRQQGRLSDHRACGQHNLRIDQYTY